MPEPKSFLTTLFGEKDHIFLWNTSEDWNSCDDFPSIPTEDPEVKNVSARATQTQEPKLHTIILSSLQELLTYFSSWHRAKKAIALCLWHQQRSQKIASSTSQLKRKNGKKQQEIATYKPVDVQDLKYAEQQIIKIVRNEAFQDEIELLKDKPPLNSCKDKVKVMNRSSLLF